MTVDVVIAGNVVCDAIMGCAAQASIMPYHVMESLGLKPSRPSAHSLCFPGDSETVPEGVIEDVPVDVGRVRILTTFHVLRMRNPKNSYTLLLGMPWLKAAKAMIKFDKDGRFMVKIRDGNEIINIHQRKKSNYEQPTPFSSVVEIGRSINQ